jgi:hypothetical protein
MLRLEKKRVERKGKRERERVRDGRKEKNGGTMRYPHFYLKNVYLVVCERGCARICLRVRGNKWHEIMLQGKETVFVCVYPSAGVVCIYVRVSFLEFYEKRHFVPGKEEKETTRRK